MGNNSVESGQTQIVEEEAAGSALLHACSMEEETFSTVPVDLEEQMGGLNLNSNILPWQPQNRNLEGSLQQQQQRHHGHLHPHPHPARLYRHLHWRRNANTNRNQQQMTIANINLNLQRLEEELHHIRVAMNRNRKRSRLRRHIRHRLHQCSRLFPVCREVRMASATPSSNSAAIACECCHDFMLD
jgi:hypothetical protein